MGRMTRDSGSATKPGIRADFWFGLGLLSTGLAVAVESWRMPRLAELNVHPMTAPGLVPGMIGVIIAVLGSILFMRAARAGGWRAPRRDGAAGPDLSNQIKRFFIALTLCLGYAAGLVGSVPFWAATGAFAFLFTLVFEWRGDRPLAGHVHAIAMAALLAVIVAAAVTYIFESVFLVRLP